MCPYRQGERCWRCFPVRDAVDILRNIMKLLRWISISGSLLLTAALLLQAAKTDGWDIMTGADAWADAVDLVPGNARRITVDDLPQPTSATPNFGKMVPRPANAWPKAPEGFTVELYAENQGNVRQIKRAPNGDLFVAERGGGGGRGGGAPNGRIVVYRGVDADGKAETISTFTGGLNQPFGVAFYPANNPQWLYVTETDSLMRFPYRVGDLEARGEAEMLVEGIPGGGGHWTRDIVFSPDEQSLFLAVGSASNIDDPDTSAAEYHRANILEYRPDGEFVGIFASGIRNPVGLGVHPETGELWTSVNERDNLGDNLVPDYITHVERGGFYGWPYFYIGNHPDERLMGAHLEMADDVIVPDVLIQPHSASLGLTFYTGDQFPEEYKNDLFAAEHGSWNRSVRAGHEVVRVPLDNGKSNGVYQDFLTGFVTEDGDPWGRPVGVEVGQNGELYVTDDGSQSIWRVTYTGN